MRISGTATGDSCANCGGPGDRLEEVRRMYVTIDDGGRVTGSETMGSPERWCPSCRSLYLHEAQGSGTDGGTPDAGATSRPGRST